MPEVAEALQRKIGPAPVWVWGIGIGAGVLVLRTATGRSTFPSQSVNVPSGIPDIADEPPPTVDENGDIADLTARVTTLETDLETFTSGWETLLNTLLDPIRDALAAIESRLGVAEENITDLQGEQQMLGASITDLDLWRSQVEGSPVVNIGAFTQWLTLRNQLDDALQRRIQVTGRIDRIRYQMLQNRAAYNATTNATKRAELNAAYAAYKKEFDGATSAWAALEKLIDQIQDAMGMLDLVDND
jgi:chromosome segregation ATPase